MPKVRAKNKGNNAKNKGQNKGPNAAKTHSTVKKERYTIALTEEIRIHILYIPIYPPSLYREYRYYIYRETKAAHGGDENSNSFNLSVFPGLSGKPIDSENKPTISFQYSTLKRI